MDQQKFYRLTNLASGTCGAGIIGVNETCQHLAKSGVIEYQIAYGYLTDIFAVPFITGIFLARKVDKKIDELAPPLIATTYSVMEIAGISGKFDPYDVLAYWTGAVLAYSIMKFGKSEKLKAIVEEINPLKKKQLEDLVN